ncbi:unnamed protein product [Cunninghamella blakesleeana]
MTNMYTNYFICFQLFAESANWNQRSIIHCSSFLIEWLSHSKKKYCELCEHPFTLICRALIVGIVWLIILPYSTLWTWRFYFWSGETLSFFAAPVKNTNTSTDTTSTSVTINDDQIQSDEISTTFISRIINLMTFPITFQWRNFLLDCFEGQVITTFVIVIFIAAYLFREWAMQNLPVDDHEDEDEDELLDQQQQVPPLFGRQPIANDNDLLRQRVLMDTLNAINNNDNNGLDRDEFQTRLAEMLAVIDQKRNTDEENQADNINNIGSSSSTNQIRMKDDNDISDDEEEDDHEDLTWLRRSLNNEQNASSSSTTIRKGKQIDIPATSSSAATTSTSDSNRMDQDGSESSNNNNNSNRNHTSRYVYRYDDDHNDEDNNNDDDTNPFTRRSITSTWYHEHDSDEEIHKRRWRAPEFSDDEDDLHLDNNNDLLNNNNNNNDNSNTNIMNINNSTNNHNHNHNHNRINNINQPLPPPVPPMLRMPPPPPPPQFNFVEENDNDNDDGGDGEMEPFDFGDDIDGVLEAIGMRGNPWMLLQNSVLMSLMVSLCLGVAVWIPYVVGRLVISIKPMSFIQTPIFMMRLITDPIVDFILDRCIPFVWKWLTSIIAINRMLPESIQVAINTTLSKSANVMNNVLTDSSSSTNLASVDSLTTTTATTSQSIDITQFDQLLQWNNIQRGIEMVGDMVLKRWQQFAHGQSGLDRTMCILVGYFVLVLIGSWYLGRSNNANASSSSAAAAAQRRRRNQQRNNNGNAENQGDAIQDILRQQGDFLKVVFFIVIELVIFPLCCGILLDGCTLPLFASATRETRYAFYESNPYSSCFLHWFFGTGFLFGVAVFVALCREIVRPGVIWFIRDPNDPQFHPIREMIERPTLPLLQKILHSAMMYAGLILAAVGTVVYFLDYTTNIFPLFVPLDTPFSTLPLDLLGVQFLLSPLISFLKPRDYAKTILKIWWKWASKQLRLTSFMFNGRHIEEEGTHIRRTFKAWILREKAPMPTVSENDDHVFSEVGITDDNNSDNDRSSNSSTAPVIFKRNGQLLRVPKLDTVPVVPHRRMLVPIDPVTLEPIDEEERLAGLHPAASQSGDEELSTTIVYAPPHFKMRLILFIVLMWLSSTLLTCTLSVVPVCLGRVFFNLFVTEKQVHDIYCFTLGVYIMVSLGLLIDWASNKHISWQESGSELNQNTVLQYLKEKLQLGAKLFYLLVTLGFILPLMLGIVVDLYLFMPLRYSIHDQPMVLHLSEDWVFGIAYMSVIYGVIQVLPNNQWKQFMDGLFGNGITRISSWVITRSFFLPVMLGTILAITIPGIMAWGCVKLLDDASRMLILVRWMYPLVFSILFTIFTAYLFTKLIKIWAKSIRDDTYLIGKQLHNLDQDSTTTPP